MTERLYYKDSHMQGFSACVLSCEPWGDGFAVTLDRTAFFPVGGGQAADTGRIGAVLVTGVTDAPEYPLHLTDAPLTVGCGYDCAIDWEPRFRRMQSHGGEHIISGTVHRLFGFDNVGFHMGACDITLDFDGELSGADVERVEREANEAVWRNVPVTARFVPHSQLSGIEYRSKKVIEGDVRLVTIEGVDICACCAPHVTRTGEIGLIRITDAMRHRGGTRLTAVCGSDAYEDVSCKLAALRDIARLLSAKQPEANTAVRRMHSELEDTKRRLSDAGGELLRLRAAAIPETDGSVCFFVEDADMPALRELVNEGMSRCGGIFAAFAGSDGDYKYIIGSSSRDLRQMSREINAAVKGRGGGSATMIQGSAAASRAVIEAYFSGLD